MLRKAGLEPVGVDLSAFGMIRALAGVAVAGIRRENPEGADPGGAAHSDQAVLFCNLGDVMNLAVARGRSCLFTRVSTHGLEALASRLAGELGLSPEHAMQWLTYVGLERPAEEIEGDRETVAATRRVLEQDVPGLVDELRLSLDYYARPGERDPGRADRPLRTRQRHPRPLAADRSRNRAFDRGAALPPALAGYDGPTRRA